MNYLEWYSFPDTLPPHNTDVLALTKAGELVRSRFICVVYVERSHNYYDSPFPENLFRFVGNSSHDPVFIPLNELKEGGYNDFHKDITHWCHMPNMPSVPSERKT